VALKVIGKFSIVQNKRTMKVSRHESLKHFKVQMLHERYFAPNWPHHCSNR